MPHYYERDYNGRREQIEFPWCKVICCIIVLYSNYLYLRELEKDNPDLYWIMLIAG